MSRPKLTNPKVVNEMLSREGVKLSHSLGQNFLINESIIQKILKLADVKEKERILEIGPGIGVLTAALLEAGASVVSIEKDSRLAGLLLDNISFAKDNFKLIEGDALEIDKLKHSIYVNNSEKLVANLPYNIAATLIFDYFWNFKGLKSATVMVQKEVAQRMMAKQGTKNYGAYTVKLSLLVDVNGYFFVGRNNFLPAPHVDSCVIRLDRISDEDEVIPHSVLQSACVAADAAFFSRRKTILNSMLAYFACNSASFALNKEEISEVLDKCDIDPRRRGETLGKNDFISLGRLFEKMAK